MKRRTARLGALVFSMLLLGATAAFAATQTVTPGAPDGWTAAQEGSAPGTVEWSADNAAPGYGSGSIHFATTASNQGPILGNADNFDGLRFDELTELSYWSYKTSGGPVHQVALQVNVDYDLTDASASWQGRLVFEPYYTAGVTSDGTWYEWDALAGKWWSTGAPGNTQCPQSAPCTMAQVLTHFPNAGVHADPLGAMLFKAGSGWASFDGYVDALTVGTAAGSTTYDFEVVVDDDGDGIPDTAPPASKDDCKKGGWSSFNNPTFKNQGDCVSYVASGGKKGPKG